MPENPAAECEKRERDQRFLKLLAQHELRLASFVHALVPHWRDAEEILQETRVQLWEEFERFDEGSDFAAWACTLAKYQILTYRKRQSRQPAFSEAMLDRLASKATHPPQPEDDRRLAALAQCVRKLGQSARTLLERCYVDGIKIKDVAEELGRSVPGTYSTLSRIRKSLLECVRDRLQLEGDGP